MFRLIPIEPASPPSLSWFLYIFYGGWILFLCYLKLRRKFQERQQELLGICWTGSPLFGCRPTALASLPTYTPHVAEPGRAR